MLTTDLHNPNVRSKMSKADWLKNNSGNNKGQDFDKDFLLGIYDRIAAEEFKLGVDVEEEEEQPIEGEASLAKQKEDEHCRKRFGLPSDEIIVRDYSCIWKRSGRLYIAQKHLCFYAKMFGIKEKVSFDRFSHLSESLELRIHHID